MSDEIIKEAPQEEKTITPEKPEVVKPEKEEMVSMTKADLAEIKEVIGTVKELKKENERLTFAADKSRLAQFDSSNSDGKKLKEVKVNFWEGKPVLAWSMIKDEIVENAITGILKPEQIIRLYHENKDDYSDIDYLNFKKVSKKKASVTKDETDSVSQERVLTVVVDETGKEYKLSVSFVN